MGDLALFYQFWQKWTADKLTQILYIRLLTFFIMPLADFLLFSEKFCGFGGKTFILLGKVTILCGGGLIFRELSK